MLNSQDTGWDSTWEWPTAAAVAEPAAEPRISVDDLPEYVAQFDNVVETGWWDGEKYPGGFGPTELLTADYWTLRARSEQLFTTNMYARGIIERLVTNEINTGLTLESEPAEKILGRQPGSMVEWAENVETLFSLYANTPGLCDFYDRLTFGGIQRQIRRQALISGDVLVVLSQSDRYKTPKIQVVKGSRVSTPLDYSGDVPETDTVIHGVHLDSDGRQAGYFVEQSQNYLDTTGATHIYIPAKGTGTGRKSAWLVYGSELRVDDVRGESILGITMQSLKEIDRYRDATQRKAAINAILAMFIKNTAGKMGTNPVQGGAVKKGTVTSTDSQGSTNRFKYVKQMPGVVMEELNEGEEPVVHSTAGTDTNFSTFETAIIRAIAWSNEIPPEVLILAYDKSFNASQAAISEFKMYLGKVTRRFTDEFLYYVYEDWFISMAYKRKISAPGFLQARTSVRDHDIYLAWLGADWIGTVKPSTDIAKTTKGYKSMTDEGWCTNARAARELNGTKFSKNVQKLAEENALKAAAMKPLLELKQQYGEKEVETALAAVEGLEAAVIDAVNEG